MVCPACSKRLPSIDRFCAYCGTSLSSKRRARLAEKLRTLPRSMRVLALGGLMLGGVFGGLIGVPLGSPLLGALLGALGVGGSAALCEPLAGMLIDRYSALRFGERLGALGGGLTLAGGALAGLWVRYSAGDGAPGGLSALPAFVSGSLADALPGAIVGAVIGIVFGAVLGRYLAAAGYRIARRSGGILGAAAGFTLGSLAGGSVAGAETARAAGSAGAALLDGAMLGAVLQLLAGVLLLAGLSRLLRTWQRRP